jgi:hypothetical protein
MQSRIFWFAASLGLGLLQGWDSGAFSSGLLPLALTLVGIGLPTVAIAVTRSDSARIGALVVGAVLLVGARLAAPGSLNALHLALFPAALYILILRGLFSDGQRQAA